MASFKEYRAKLLEEHGIKEDQKKKTASLGKYGNFMNYRQKLLSSTFGDIDLAGVQSWFEEGGNTIQGLSDYYTANEGKWVSDYGADYTDSIASLRDRATAVGYYLKTHKDEFEDYASLNNAYKEYVNYLNEAEQQNSNLRRFYSQFGSEDEYNAWYDNYQKYAIDREDKDFDKYSQKGASVSNPDWNSAHAPFSIGGWTPFGDGEDIANMVTFAENNSGEAVKAAAASMRSGGSASPYTDVVNLINLYMKPEEKALYNYYVGKGDTKKASEYLTYITDILRQRQGGEIAAQVDEKFLLEGMTSFIAGMDQAASGFRNIDNFFKGTEGDPTTALQYAYGITSANNKGLRKVGNDLAMTTGNMLPSILVGTVTGGTAGAVTLGISAAGNAYSEMRDLGYNANQARAYATLTGASEAILSKALSGISALGGGTEGIFQMFASKIIPSLDKAAARVAIELGGKVADEALEEMIQEVLDPVFKMVSTGEKFEGIDWENVFYSGLLGGLSAGALEGAPTIYGNVKATYDTNVQHGGLTVGQGIKATFKGELKNAFNQGRQAVTQSAQGYISDALEIDPNNAHAQRMQARINEGKNVSGYQINRLVTDSENALVNLDKNKITEGIKARLAELGEGGDLDLLASAILKNELGEKLSKAEKNALENSTNAEWVAEELDPDSPYRNFNDDYSRWAEALGTKRINVEAYNRAVTAYAGEENTTSATKSAPKTETATEAENKASVGKVNANIKSVSVKDGKAVYTLANGETVDADKVGFASKMHRAVADIATDKMTNTKGFTEEAATAMIKGYDGSVNPSKYEDLFMAAFNVGAEGKAASTLTSIINAGVSERTAFTAYELGKNSVLQNESKSDIIETENAEAKNESGKSIHLRGSVQRNNGENTEGQLPRVEKDSGKTEGRRDSSRSTADEEATRLVHEGREVTVADLGIPGGSKYQKIYRLEGVEETAEMKKARKAAEKRGLVVRFFAGDNLMIETEGGRIENIRGYIQGKYVYIRADHPYYTADQIMRHELGHDMVAKGEISIKKVIKRLTELVGEENVEAVLDNYAEAYGKTGLNEAEIWEEIVCDSLGDMNIFAGDKVISEFMAPMLKDIKQATQETKGEANQTRGSPDGKASRGGVTKKLYVFSPYNESQSDANEIATRWAHRSDIKTGDAHVIAYHGSFYLVEKFDSSDLGYQIVDQLTKEQYYDYIKEHSEDGTYIKGQSSEESLYTIDTLDRRGDRTGRGEHSFTFAPDGQRGENIQVQRLGNNKAGGVKDKGNRSGGLQSSGENQQKSSRGVDTSHLPIRQSFVDVAGRRRNVLGIGNGQYMVQGTKKINYKFNSIEEAISAENENIIKRYANKSDSTVTWVKNKLLEDPKFLAKKARSGKFSRELDFDYDEILNKKNEVNKLREDIRQIEESEDFKSAIDSLTKAVDNDDVVGGIKAYEEWKKSSGYGDLIAKRDSLLDEISKLQKGYEEQRVSNAQKAEKEAIEKSGLSEADYFRKQAEKEFGYTPYYYDAGYILPSGKMLNFSGEKGKHFGTRGEDHRAIGIIYADTHGTKALTRFMNDGNIRIMAESPGLDIAANVEPSSQQYATIKDFIYDYAKEQYFNIDLSDDNGRVIGTLEYEGKINATRIINDIKHYYETGEIRGQSEVDKFRFSRELDTEYLTAVENGDIETAQRMVDEAAKKAGYKDTLYHGTKNFGFTEFDASRSDDKISFFVTSSEDMAQTYSGKYGSMKISDLEAYDNKPLHEVVKKLREISQESYEGKQLNSQYKIMSMTDVNSLIMEVNDGIEKLKNTVVEKIKDYAEILATDFNDSDYKTHEYLVKLQGLLDNHSYSEMSTPIYILLHRTEAFDRSAQIADLEYKIRLMNRLANKDTSNGVVVEKQLDGYGIALYTPEEAREALKALLSSGNYKLYGNPGNQLVIKGEGQNWNKLKNWQKAVKKTTENTYVKKENGNYVLYDKATDKVIEDSKVSLNQYNENLPLDTMHSILVNKENNRLAILTEGKTTTRDIAKFAKDNGYDSVKFENIEDNGGHGEEAPSGDVYAYFSSSNLKSADPVTYDDEGKVIPLSERFNPENNDIRYSRELERDYNNFGWVRENDVVSEGYWDNFTRNYADAVKNKNYDRITSNSEYMIPIYDETLPEREQIIDHIVFAKGSIKSPVVSRIIQIYEFDEKKLSGYRSNIYAFEREGIRQETNDILEVHAATDFRRYGNVKNNSRKVSGHNYQFGTKRGGSSKTANRVKEYVFEQEVDGKYSRELDLIDYINEQSDERVEIDGTLTNREILANALESAAQSEEELEALKDYKKNIKELNKKAYVLSKMKEDIKRLSFAKGQKDTAKINELKAKAKKVEGSINYYDRQLLNLEANKVLKDVLAREKKAAYKRAAEKGREALNKNVEGRRKSEARGKIKSLKQKFQHMLEQPTERQYVPAGLVSAMVKVCEMVDTSTDLYKADGSINKAQQARNEQMQRLLKLQDEYDKIKKNPDAMIAEEYDEEIAEYLNEIRQNYEGKNIADMTLDELTELYRTMKAIEETLRDARKLIGVTEAESVYDAADSIIEEQRDITSKRKDGKRSFADKAMDNIDSQALSPLRAVLKMAGYNEDSMLYKLMRDIENGEREAQKFVMDASKAFEALTTGENADNYEDAIYKPYGKELIDKNGKKFHVSKMQMMQAIMSYEREQANSKLHHVSKGGFSFADIDLLAKGKLKDAISAENAHTVTLGSNAAIEFIAELANDKWAQAYMAEARKFFDETAKEAINDANMTLKHRIVATGSNYIPYEVNKDYVVREITAENDIQQVISGYGMLKDLKDGATQPIIITGLNNILGRHIEQVSKVHGLAVPIRNFNKVWNVKASDGSTTVQEQIGKNWGDEGKEIVTQAVKDVQGARISRQPDWYRTLKGNYIGGVFLLNGSVIAKQVGSMFSAVSMIKYRNPASMLANLATTIKNYDTISAEVDKYTAAVWMRRQGLSDAELYTFKTEAQKSKIGRWTNKKVPTALNPSKWITAMDSAVALSLWKYCKEDVASRTGLTGEELNRETAKYFEDVVQNTQSMSDSLHRPEIQKSDNVASEILGMFKTDLYQGAGQLRVAYGKWKANPTQENKTAFARTVVSSLSSMGWGALMTSLFALLRYKVNPYRDDEDDELTFASWIKVAGADVVAEMVGYLFPLFGSEVAGTLFNIAHGDTVDDLDSVALTAVNDLVDAITTISNNLKEGEMPSIKAYKAILTKMAALFGVPASNVIRAIEAIKLHAQDIANGEFFSFEAGLTKPNAQRLYNAYVEGNEDKIKKASRLYKTQKDIEAALRKALRENDPRVKEAAEAYNDGDLETYERIISEIVKEGHFNSKLVSDAVKAEANNLAPSSSTTEEETDKDKAYSIYQAKDINTALDKGDTAYAKKIIDELVKTKQANGMTEKNAKSSVKSSITSYWKPLYVAAYEKGNNAEMTRIRFILRDCGLYGNADEIIATVNGWVKN